MALAFIGGVFLGGAFGFMYAAMLAIGGRRDSYDQGYKEGYHHGLSDGSFGNRLTVPMSSRGKR